MEMEANGHCERCSLVEEEECLVQNPTPSPLLPSRSRSPSSILPPSSPCSFQSLPSSPYQSAAPPIRPGTVADVSVPTVRGRWQVANGQGSMFTFGWSKKYQIYQEKKSRRMESNLKTKSLPLWKTTSFAPSRLKGNTCRKHKQE